ncbi:MAG: copper homeostasis protein CutC [Prevotellaceae bacterium]|jgi:copper homeostasis protein|nr:copper homeostasis protein CutC [Prevotellaceae bacterium]
MTSILEICAYSIADCIEAECGGAGRVELCSSMPEGGITPSYGTIITVRKHTNITMNVMIRPRGGNFVYTEHEIRIMLEDISMSKRCGADGLVFGCLTADGEVDVNACRRLLDKANPLPVTFHRAFDRCRHPEQALEEIIKLGFSRLLTSGQQPTAEEGISLLQQMVVQSAKRILIMPGSGITPDNIAEIAAKTGANEFHTSAQAVRGKGTDAGTVAKCVEKIKNIYTVAGVSETQIKHLSAN